MELELSGLTPAQTTSDSELLKAEYEAAQAPTISLSRGFGLARELDNINFFFGEGAKELAPDPNFTGYTPEQFKTLTGSVPEEHRSRLQSALGDAMSYAHGEQIAQQFHKELAQEQELGKLGWTGVGLRVAAGLTDPEAWAVSIATDGAAAPFLLASKLGRAGKAVAAGLASAGSNMAVEAIANRDNASRGLEDILYAGVAGFVLGAPAGLLMGPGKEVVKAASNLQRTLEADAALPSVAGDSAGAARASYRRDPEVDIENLAAHAETMGDLESSTFLRGWRIDMASDLKGDKNPVFNLLGNILFDDPAGTPRETATAWKRLELDGRVNRFYRAVEENYVNGYAKDMGFLQRNGMSTRAEFFENVGRAIRGEAVSDPHVQAMAKHIAEQQAELLELAKMPGAREGKNLPGVKDFSAVAENENYLARSWASHKIDKMRDKFGDHNLEQFVKQAIIRGSEEIEEGLAERMAKGLLRAASSAKFSHGVNMTRILAAEGQDVLKRILREETDMSPEAVESTAKLLARDLGDGKTDHAKRRVKLDETFAGRLGRSDLSGEEALRMSDFFENDAEKLFLGYASNLTGNIALARQGITSRGDFDRLLTQAENAANGTPGYKRSTFDRNREVAEMTWKYLQGQSLEREPGSVGSMMGRILRDINYTRVMNQAGLASISELGNAVGQLGFKALMTHMPEFRRMMSRMKDGKLEDGVADELEVLFGGVGSGRLMSQVTNRLDDEAFGAATDYRILQKADQTLQYTKRLTSDIGGMFAVNQTLQRLTLKGIAQKFTDLAAKPTKANLNRMRDIGLPEPMLNRVLAQIEKHTVKEKSTWSGRKFRSFQIDKWDDAEAATAFRIAGNRLARRIIQEGDFGETARWMHGTVAKILLQFRSFTLTGYAKQSLYLWKYKDAEAWTSFALSGLMGAMVYAGQTYVNSIGREDQGKFLADRLSTERIAATAFSRSAYASIIPGVVDTVAVAGITDDPIFAYGRTTGLGSDLITGNPTVDLLDKLAKGTGGMTKAMLRDDYQYSEKDAKALYSTLLFQNALGLTNVATRLMQELPDFSN